MTQYCLVNHDRDSWTMKFLLGGGVCDEQTYFVPNSRHQDECWAKKFPGGKNPDGTTSWSAYPAPRKHFARPLSGGNAVRLNPAWWKYIKAINLYMTGNLDGWNAGLQVDGGWINMASNPDYPSMSYIPDPPPLNKYPIVEGITGILTIHEVLEMKQGSARIKNFLIGSNPPDPLLVNPVTNPEMFVLLPSIDPLGRLGFAPKGYKFWFPVLAKGESWLTADKITVNVAPPIPPIKEEEPMTIINRAWGVDISKWNGNYNDDGIDEGFPDLSFVILKAWDGWYDRTSDPYSTFKAQYDSVESIPYKGGYGWYQTEQLPITQADLALSIAEKDIFDFMPVDYEAYLNVIDEKTANDLREFVDHFRERSPLKVPIYTNGWILTLLRTWLGSWLDTVDIWFAGGSYYNKPLTVPIVDTIMPAISEQFTFWQFSADKNMVADELDFSVVEGESIDVNVFYSTEEVLGEYLDNPTIIIPPPTGTFDDGFNSALEKINEYSTSIKIS